MKTAFILAAVLTVAVVEPGYAGVIDIGQAFSTTLQPYVNAIIEAGITLLVAYVLYIAKNKFHVDIDKSYRDALTAFLQRQAASLVADGAVKLQGVKLEVRNEALATAANAAFTAIPQVLQFFNLTPDKLREMIVDHLPKEPSVAAAQAVALDVANPATPTPGVPPLGLVAGTAR